MTGGVAEAGGPDTRWGGRPVPAGALGPLARHPLMLDERTFPG
jgi:hypothetical protein